MRTFEQIKSEFRVYQIDDEFYIQRKKTFGWSYDTAGKFTDFTAFTGIFCFGSSIFLIISSIIALFSWSINNGMIVSFFVFLMFYIAHFLYLYKNKNLALSGYSLFYAESVIDEQVKNILEKLEKEEKEKVEKELKKKNKIRKIHYFYTPSQLRKEKLKKLKN